MNIAIRFSMFLGGVAALLTACAQPKLMNKPLEFGTDAGISAHQLNSERMPNEEEKAPCFKNVTNKFEVLEWQRVQGGKLHGFGGVYGEKGYTDWGREFDPIDEKDVRLFKRTIKGPNFFGVVKISTAICFYKYKDGKYSFIQLCGMRNDRHPSLGSLHNCPLRMYKRKQVPWKPVGRRVQ